MKSTILNTGFPIPLVGLGTYSLPSAKIPQIIEHALNQGYRLFDCAWKYKNEKIIGNTLKASGIKREELFISSMLNIDALYHFGYYYGKRRIFNIRNTKTIRDAILESFDNLGVDYMDLFLVHWPWFNYRDMYVELTKLHYEGRIRSIGVCSCLPQHIEALKEVSDIIPAVNQIEISPLNTQKKLICYCQKNGIHIEAMSVFSHFRSNKPRLEILNNPAIIPIAKKYGKTIAQIVLRWLIQQEITVIPKSCNPHYIADNISVFDFQLSKEDMLRIDSLDKGSFLNYNPYNAINSIPDNFRQFNYE